VPRPTPSSWRSRWPKPIGAGGRVKIGVRPIPVRSSAIGTMVLCPCEERSHDAAWRGRQRGGPPRCRSARTRGNRRVRGQERFSCGSLRTQNAPFTGTRRPQCLKIRQPIIWSARTTTGVHCYAASARRRSSTDCSPPLNWMRSSRISMLLCLSCVPVGGCSWLSPLPGRSIRVEHVVNVPLVRSVT
jgi:hypothetical protein